MKPIIESGSMRVYLVQRGSFKDTPDEKITGIDDLIEFDYMGSSEFEGGTLFAALQHFLSHYDDIVAMEIGGLHDIDTNGLTVFCLSHQKENAIATIRACAKEQYPDLKEHCGIWEYVTGGSFDTYNPYHPTNFWWSLGDRWEKSTTQWMACPSYMARRLAMALERSYVKKLSKDKPGIPLPRAIHRIAVPDTVYIKPSVRVERDRGVERRGERRYLVTDGVLEYRINMLAVASVERNPDSVVVKMKNNHKHVVKCSGPRLEWFASNVEKATTLVRV